MKSIIAPQWRPERAALAGLIATAAYSIAMEGDRFFVGNRFNDVRFIEGLLGGGRSRSRRLTIISWLVHFANGAALAEIYAAVIKRFLPGPGWLRGAIFGQAFVIGVWGLTPLADKYHPLIKNGAMPRLATWTAFLQNSIRHLAFGLTLGWLYRD